MARNSSGSYTLPVGNPVTTGTTITSSWANSTLTDLATEMTDSLSRSGKGEMTAPLKAAVGSSLFPSITFAGDTDTGFYHSTADNLSAAAGGIAVFSWTPTQNTSTVPLALPDGDATKAALGFTLEANSGLYRAADKDLRLAINGADVQTWTENGSSFNQNIQFTGSAPATTDAIANALSPIGFVKAWATVLLNNTTSPSVNDGLNIASITQASGGDITVTFPVGSPMSGNNYAVIAMGDVGYLGFEATNRTSTSFKLKLYDGDSATGSYVDMAGSNGRTIFFLVLGRQ